MTKEKKFLIYGICLVLVLLLGLTYAYFSSIVRGDKKKITVDTNDLKIVFDNGDDIEGTNIEPGWGITKTFSVENKTNYEYKYNLVFKDLINTFVTKGYLVYKITSTDGGYSMIDYEDIPKSTTLEDIIIKYSVVIASNTKHNYTLELKYISDDDVDQSADMEKEVSGKIFIEEGTDEPGVLVSSAILRDNPTVSERTDFSVTNTETTTGTIYKTNKTEDGSDVYYYSGNTTNNWVYFGGFYWRIIRTNEDGGVRLLYSGTSTNTENGFLGSTKFNIEYNDLVYEGYMYGTSGTIDNNRTNENNSTIKTYIDEWYENNLLTNYDKYISKTAIYCNDRSYASKYEYVTSKAVYYGSYTRLVDNKTPSYKCGTNPSGGLFESTQAIADKFSASTTSGGNGKLKYPIALATADELVFAGGKTGTKLTSPYAWYYLNSEGNSITGNSWIWLLSPRRWTGSGATIWLAGGTANSGNLSDGRSDYAYYVARPAISLASCVLVTGTGTPTNPYIVDEVNSNC